MSAIQGSEKNLSVSQLGTTKLAVYFPKPTAESKLAAQEQVKRRVESLKNELRELRRKDINKFRSSCKDKDSIHKFENDTQNEFDVQVKAIDALHANLLRSK
jgi:ribosome recycling factor